MTWVYVISAVVLLFGASVFVHEFGHFWVARRFGLKVDRFSIGFGPRLFGWTRNGVEYAWRLIPAGGFVALPQMVSSEALEGGSQSKESLPPISPFSKILVALAGPAMNLVFAFVLGTWIYLVGLPVRVNPAIIGGVEPGSAEANLGIRAGDRIVAVNGKSVRSWDEVQMTTAMARTNVLPVTIERAGVRTTYLLKAQVNPALDLKLLNLEPSERPVIEGVRNGSAAAQAGLKEGDLVLSFAGARIAGEQQLVNLVQKRAGQPTRIEVKRQGQHLALTVTPRLDPKTKTGLLGIVLAPNPVTVYELEQPGPPPWRLIGQVCRQTYDTIAALVHSRQTGVGVRDLSGPPGILAMLAIELKADYRLALKFMVLLNVSLAIVNVLPLPVLDGGHIAVALLEALLGRPLSPRLQQNAATVFAVLLISFMIYVSYNDLVRRFSLFKSMLNQQVHVQSGPAPAAGSGGD